MQECIFTRRLSLPMRPRNIAAFGSMRPCIIAAFLERHDILICRRREHPVTEARTNPSKVFPIRRAEVSSSRKRLRSTGPSAERRSESSSSVHGHNLRVFTAHVRDTLMCNFAYEIFHNNVCVCIVIHYATKIRIM